MKQEHENKHGISVVSVADQASAVSEIAALSAKVIEYGLIREYRPVFVFDAKLAKNKTANAARQAKFREKKAQEGFVFARIPAELAELLKVHEGNWQSVLMRGDPATPAPQGGEAPPLTPPAPGGGTPQFREIIKEVIVEVVKEVPGPVRIVEKIVEKQVLKLTSEQRKTLEIGQKVRALTGWRARVLAWILS